MCEHKRILEVSAKCSDMCFCRYGLLSEGDSEVLQSDSYVPEGIGITDGHGYGDYVAFNLCMDCGTIVTPGVKFPISDSKIAKALKERQ